MFAKAEFTKICEFRFVNSKLHKKTPDFICEIRKETWVGIICGVVPQNLKVLWNRVLAKAEFTNPIPQKIRLTKKCCGIPQNRVFAKAEFTNLNFTKKLRILFVESEVEVDLRKRNRFSTKYLTGRKNTWVGIICGVVPQNLKILWNS